MKIFLIIIAVLLFLILFILFKNFSVEIKTGTGRTQVRIGGKYLKIKFYDSKIDKNKKGNETNIESNSEKQKPKKNNSFKEIKNKILAFKKLYSDEKGFIKSVLSQLKDSIELSKLDYSMHFGFGEAAITGIANGFFWTTITFATGILDKYFETKEISNIALLPEFTEKVFETKLIIEFSGRPYKFIIPLLNIRSFLKRNCETINLIKEGEQ